jgi:hypothetical protein
MPFTFSHPAIVLPLSYLPKKWISLTGLIVGSITPDFEYFLRMKVQSNYSHTICGIFWFDLPLAILLTFIFHNVVRNDLFNNIPAILRERLLKFKQLAWNDYFKKNLIAVLISIIAGICSHLIWDSFTHANGYFVKGIPALTNQVKFFNIDIPVFKIVQHASTLIGGLIIVFALLKMPAANKVNRTINLRYWGFVILSSLVIISIRLFTGLNYLQYGNLIVTAISAVMIGLILTPLVISQKN